MRADLSTYPPASIHPTTSSQNVAAGERVAAGQVLGWTGTTGNARGTPPHLHFEYRTSSARRGPGVVGRADPAGYLCWN
ncbi:MAG: M23 family metallopeptidase [bacterium]